MTQRHTGRADRPEVRLPPPPAAKDGALPPPGLYAARWLRKGLAAHPQPMVWAAHPQREAALTPGRTQQALTHGRTKWGRAGVRRRLCGCVAAAPSRSQQQQQQQQQHAEAPACAATDPARGATAPARGAVAPACAAASEACCSTCLCCSLNAYSRGATQQDRLSAGQALSLGPRTPLLLPQLPKHAVAHSLVQRLATGEW